MSRPLWNALLSDAAHHVYTRALQDVEPRFDSAALELGLSVFRPRRLTRGQYLIQQGESCNQLVLVLEGLLRSYCLTHDGNERTTAFAPEGSFAASMAGLLASGPAPVSIVAEETTLLLVTSCTEYMALTRSSPLWDSFWRKSGERWFVSKAQREHELLTLDAAERRAALLHQLPGIEGRVAARHVASYLGITSVHLSRLRRRQAKLRTA